MEKINNINPTNLERWEGTLKNCFKTSIKEMLEGWLNPQSKENLNGATVSGLEAKRDRPWVEQGVSTA